MSEPLVTKSCRPTRTEQGVRWRVWAPRAAAVELVLLSESDSVAVHSMQRDLWGYHELTLPNIEVGQRYGYRLDGGQLLPDPCSMWQPQGVHRPSAIFFPDQFHWSDQQWPGIARSELVFYEVHVGTFTAAGTLDAMIERLPTLRELGITALEIMPIAQFPGERNWGYDGAHLMAAQHSYGGPAAVQRLVDAAHACGLAVILDVVLNHFGPEGNYIGQFGPYYSSRYTTPWGPAFNFDGRDSDAVRDLVLDCVWQWIHDFHFDGLRLDAVHAMFDNSPVHILTEIKQVADQAAQSRTAPALIIAESLMNDVRMVRPVQLGGYGLDAEWNEDFHHALVAFLTGERSGKYVDFGAAQQLAHVLEHTFHLSGNYSRFRRRRWGAPVGDISGDRFVIGTQNHDHIGNRARGERLSQLVAPSIQRLCASLMLLAPYLPLIYMGEEYGEPNPFMFFCSFEDAGLIENVRAGRARDYELEGEIPDPQAPQTFWQSKLSWSWQGHEFQAGLRRLYADLLAARRQWPALRDFQTRSARLWPNEDQPLVLELHRGSRNRHQSDGIDCYFNLSDQCQSLPEQAGVEWSGEGQGRAILFRSEIARYGADHTTQACDPNSLKPYECLVWGPSQWSPSQWSPSG